ncbi:MAG TPA: T9SS type A sorting domain-containing protein [Bacteroidales bacterium]|nr:T9SS type A sorting domain-containing protein [Bacteroidales bacterium]HSA44826.1 T9SS type A sorting domain-containing protein [Bacteroidales bacterium]
MKKLPCLLTSLLLLPCFAAHSQNNCLPLPGTESPYYNSPVEEGETLGFYYLKGHVFDWTGPNNFYSDDQFNIISSADTSYDGQYRLIVWDTLLASIDTFYFDVSVTNNENTLIIVRESMVCLNSTLHLDAASGYVSYTWSGPGWNGSQQQTVDVPITSLNQAGYYYLTVFDGNNYLTESIEITVIDCCSDKEVFLINQKYASQVTTPPPEPTVVVNGFFNLDQTYDFSNITELILLPQAHIAVMDGSTLELNNVHVHGCDEMWDVIMNVGYNESMIMKNCTIQDGCLGVHSMNMSTNTNNLEIEDNIFLNNNSGLTIQENPYSYSIVDNEFYSDNNMLPPFAGDIGFAGLLIVESNITFTNGMVNSFHHLHNGVHCIDIDQVIIEPNTFFFSDITSNISMTPTSIADGCAIFSSSNTVFAFQGILEMYGNDDPNNPEFDNCSYGVYIRNNDAIVKDVHMTDMSVGIHVENGIDRYTSVDNNTIFCNDHGVNMYQNDPVDYTFIGNNYISVSNPGGLPAGVVPACIELNESGNLPDQFCSIYNNELYVNDASNFGIICRETKETMIVNNYIELNDPNAVQKGIYVEDCRAHTINCNIIYGTDPEYGNDIGIHVETTKNSTLSCNLLHNTFEGVKFDGYCTGTNFRGNMFLTHSNGLHYGDQAITGHQIDKGNVWYQACLLEGARHDNSALYINSLYRTPQSYPYWPNPNFSPLYWFDISQQNPWDCSEIEELCLSFESVEELDIAMDSVLSSYDSCVAMNELPFENYLEEIRWVTSRNLYQKLSDYPVLQVNQPVFTSFMDSIINTPARDYQDLSVFIRSTEASLSDLLLIIKDLKQSLEPHNDTLRQISGLIMETSDPAELQDLLDLRITIMASVKLLTSELNEWRNLLIQERSQMADVALGINNALEASTLIMLNEKTVNDIYLNTIAKGILGFDTQQMDNLWLIAAQCPVSGGPAVYLARSLLSAYYDTLFNDMESCLTEGIIKNKLQPAPVSNSEISFSYYPNPATGHLSLTWDLPSASNVEFLLINTTGQTCRQYTLNLEGGSTSLDISNISAGLYTVRIKSPTFEKQIGKLVFLPH